MHTRIIEYREQDKAELIALLDEFWRELTAMDPYHRFRHPAEYGEQYAQILLRKVARNSGMLFWAQAGNGEKVGLVAGVVESQSRISRMEDGPHHPGRIAELYVRPGFRRQGIGRALMRAMECYLRSQKGCDLIKVEVFAPNAVARGFYRRLGYADFVVDMCKRTQGHPAIPGDG